MASRRPFESMGHNNSQREKGGQITAGTYLHASSHALLYIGVLCFVSDKVWSGKSVYCATEKDIFDALGLMCHCARRDIAHMRVECARCACCVGG